MCLDLTLCARGFSDFIFALFAFLLCCVMDLLLQLLLNGPSSLKLTFSFVNGWMTCNFTSFSTVFRSYKDDGRMIMKSRMQRFPIYD